MDQFWIEGPCGLDALPGARPDGDVAARMGEGLRHERPKALDGPPGDTAAPTPVRRQV